MNTPPLYQEYDLAIIGGGINGCAIAADAAGRGLSVLLVEKNDLASGTSSWSTKLIHGGLRYLESYHFSMVRNALQERQVLLRRAPHLISPQQFILPHEPHLRSRALMRLGLFLYDHLSWNNDLPASGAYAMNTADNRVLSSRITRAFQYYDAKTDDCRLTLANAQLAADYQAHIHPYTELIQAYRNPPHWQLKLKQRGQHEVSVRAKALINATGPWVNHVLDNHIIPWQGQERVSLIQGSHLVIPQHYPGDNAYLFQAADRRILFAIPYQRHFTLLGTTDTPFTGPPEQATVTAAETNYLISQANRYFNHPIQTDQIKWTFSGVRALYNANHTKGAAISRDYHLAVEQQQSLPVLTVFGGKLTSHRKLAEQAINALHRYFPHLSADWTQHHPLPGGKLNQHNIHDYFHLCQQQFDWLPISVLRHYLTHYGDRIQVLLANANSINDLGQHYGDTLYQIEIEYSKQYEWAQTADDFLWRRTKYGLHLTEQEQHVLSLQF